VGDRPRRRSLTPIGDELQHREVEVGTPSLRDRWRRRRRLLPTNWYGAVLVGIVRLAIIAGIAIGFTFLLQSSAAGRMATPWRRCST
jgi:hypothetical protein